MLNLHEGHVDVFSQHITHLDIVANQASPQRSSVETRSITLVVPFIVPYNTWLPEYILQFIYIFLLAVSPLFRSACHSINSALSFPTWSNSKSNVLFCIWQQRSCLFHSWWRAGSFMLSSRRLQSKTRISPRPAGVHPQDGELTGEADMFCVSVFFFLKCGCISFSVPFTNSSSMRNMYIKQSYKPPNFGNF